MGGNLLLLILRHNVVPEGLFVGIPQLDECVLEGIVLGDTPPPKQTLT
jgi:hypothetical protein